MTTEALVKLSDDVVKAMGGLEKATAEMSFFYQEFTSESEKLADAVKAAAKTINREIPKLQGELIALSKDVTTTTTKVVKEIHKVISGVELPGAGDSGNYWAGMHDKLVDRFGEDMARMLVSIHEESNSVADGVDEYWAKMRDKLVDRFGEDLVRMIDAVHGTAEDAIKNIAAAGDKVAPETITTETTVKGDPNAAILARLLDDLPKTREGFEDLIGSINLTTEAGRKLHAALMELAPQFDLLYDGVEAFTDWLLGVNEVEQATRTLERVFAEWNMTLPKSRDALLELYNSGGLTAEQMAILAAYLDELTAIFGNLSDEVSSTGTNLDKVNKAYASLQQSVDAERKSIETQYNARMEEITAEREALEEQHQARLDQINAERDAVNAAYDARIESLNAERDAAGEAHEKRMESLSKQQEAARDALSEAEAALSKIKSALDKFRGEEPRNEMERMRALRQLGGWAAGGKLPTDEEMLDRAIMGATNLEKNDFASESAYQAAQGNAYSALLALEKVGVRQVSDAEKQLNAIEAASEKAQDAYEAQLDAMEAQSEAAAKQRDQQLEILTRQEESATAWRDQELERLLAEEEAAKTWRDESMLALDQLLEDAAKQIAILEGTYQETKSLAEAFKEFNDALLDAGIIPISGPENMEFLLPPMNDIAAATAATQAELIQLKQEIITLRKDAAASSTTQVVSLKSIDERLRKWDLDGLPDSTAGETALRAA
jgi:hypothetical protein